MPSVPAQVNQKAKTRPHAAAPPSGGSAAIAAVYLPAGTYSAGCLQRELGHLALSTVRMRACVRRAGCYAARHRASATPSGNFKITFIWVFRT
jgi:hypothetical protein